MSRLESSTSGQLLHQCCRGGVTIKVGCRCHSNKETVIASPALRALVSAVAAGRRRWRATGCARVDAAWRGSRRGDAQTVASRLGPHWGTISVRITSRAMARAALKQALLCELPTAIVHESAAVLVFHGNVIDMLGWACKPTAGSWQFLLGRMCKAASSDSVCKPTFVRIAGSQIIMM